VIPFLLPFLLPLRVSLVPIVRIVQGRKLFASAGLFHRRFLDASRGRLVVGVLVFPIPRVLIGAAPATFPNQTTNTIFCKHSIIRTQLAASVTVRHVYQPTVPKTKKSLTALNEFLPVSPASPGPRGPLLVPDVVAVNRDEFGSGFGGLLGIVETIVTPPFFLVLPNLLLLFFLLLKFYSSGCCTKKTLISANMVTIDGTHK
jgi:hypothetical protein